MPTNTHRNPANYDEWSFNWPKLQMLLIYDIKIIQNVQILIGTF